MNISVNDIARHGEYDGHERIHGGVIFHIFVPDDELEDIGGYEE